MVSQEQFEKLRSELATYETLQELGQAEMQAEVKTQVGQVTTGLQGCTTRRPWQLAQSPSELTSSRKRSAEEERGKTTYFITKT